MIVSSSHATFRSRLCTLRSCRGEAEGHSQVWTGHCQQHQPMTSNGRPLACPRELTSSATSRFWASSSNCAACSSCACARSRASASAWAEQCVQQKFVLKGCTIVHVQQQLSKLGSRAWHGAPAQATQPRHTTAAHDQHHLRAVPFRSLASTSAACFSSVAAASWSAAGGAQLDQGQLEHSSPPSCDWRDGSALLVATEHVHIVHGGGQCSRRAGLAPCNRQPRSPWQAASPHSSSKTCSPAPEAKRKEV